MATATPALPDIPSSLDALAGLVDARVHLLAGRGDAALAAAALEATKALFDLGLTLEQTSHPHIQPFILSILEPPAIALRSSTRAQAGRSAPPAEPEAALPYTPLSELTTAGMDGEQVWAQLELRNDGFGGVLRAVGAESAQVVKDEDEDEDGDEDDEDEEDDDSEEGGEGEDGEEMSVEQWERMMAEEGYEEGDSASGSEDGESVDEDDDDEDGEVDLDDEDDEDADMDGSDVSAGELGDDASTDGDDDEAEDDDELAGSDAGSDASASAASDGPDSAPSAGPSRTRAHPTLDDGFFSIDAFNRLTEEQEAGRVSAGGLGAGADEDEDDLGDLGALMLQEPGEEDEIMYGDFFEAPRGVASKGASEGKAKKAKSGGADKGKRKGKGRQLRIDDIEDESEPDEEGDDDDDDGARNVFGRVKSDLFDDDDEQEEQVLSTHERRQQALAAQIAELEAAAIGPKDWQLLGEAAARARPENSLLEENLDFEQVAKAVPVITDEKVQSLEDLIRQRIKDNNFDSVVRVRAYEPTPFLPSRLLELSDQQSTKSLAQIYEDEYTAAASAASGGAARADPRDAKLTRAHDEIEQAWGEICYKLDALSSLNFVPKQPKAQITTVENVATASLESALPPTAAASSMLAPEELFAPPTAGALVARSEQTPEQARAARSKARKHRKAERQRLGGAAELHKRRSVKEQKEDALKGLVKAGKGVTVVGKGDKEQAKRRARDEQQVHDAKRLKL